MGIWHGKNIWIYYVRNNITHVILLLLMGCILIGVLTGCGKNAETKRDNVSAIEYLSPDSAEKDNAGKDKTEENSEEDDSSRRENLTKEELDWITMEESLRPSVLQITCGNYTGSGVVWEITEEEVIIVSSGHLLKNGETCEVVCYAGIYYEAEVDRILADCDIGFAVIPVESLKADGVELKAVIPCMRNREELVQGEELAIYGSMDYVAGNFVKGYLIETEREIQFDGNEGVQTLMLGGILQEGGQEDKRAHGQIEEQADGKADDGMGEENEAKADMPKRGLVDAGMSGSGVFDRQGRLLGILTGGDGKEGFAAVPVWNFMRS